MSFVDYTDSAFPSEDEYLQDGYDADESDSPKDFDPSFDEDKVSDNDGDIDEYANFSTDYENYQDDQSRWNGIQNSRKYIIVKKTAKCKVEGENQEKTAKEDISARSTGFEKQDKPKPPPRSSRRSKSKSVVPFEPAVEIPQEGEIHFDARGDLWYSHKKGDVYLSGKINKGPYPMKTC